MMQWKPEHFQKRVQELVQIGQLDAAVAYLEAALARDPRNVPALFDMGRLELQRGRPERAAGFGRRILGLARLERPALGHLLVGNAARARGRHSEAVSSYRSALELEADLTEAICNLGGSLIECGRFTEALEALRRGVELAPHDGAMRANLGLALQRAGLPLEALEAFRCALQSDPQLHAIWLAYGGLALELGRLQEAAHAFEQAIFRAPDKKVSGEAKYNLGLTFLHQQRRLDALLLFAQSVEDNPDLDIAYGAMLYQAQWLCHWDLSEHLTPQVLDRIRTRSGMVVEPFAALSIPGATLLDHRAASAAYARRHFPPAPPLVARGHRWNDGRTRLRVGFLTCDFRTHPTAVLMAGLLPRLDRTLIEPIALTYGDENHSGHGARCIAACERHINLNAALAQSGQSAAMVIADQRLDVLLDLQSYTSGTRSEILRHRPAPVQGHFLAYWGTSACDAYDFVLLDAETLPIGEESAFSEKVLRFRAASSFPRLIPDPHPPLRREDEGLPADAPVFVSMNQAYKITRQAFHAWCSVISKVPRSVLWLKSMPRETEFSLRNAMRGWGLDPARLIVAQDAPQARHQARLRLADVGLDTWPYGSHTTGIDLLANSVPLVALCGDTPPARVSSGILRAAGLDELVCGNVHDFVEVAVRAATDREFSAGVRAKIHRSFSGEAAGSYLQRQAQEFGHLLLHARGDLA